MPAGAGAVDVAVVGASLSGLLAAVALAGPHVRTPVSLALLDSGDPAGGREPAADGRASAITLSSRRMFEALGVWPMLAPKAQPMREIVVTDSRLNAQARPALLHFGERTGGDNPAAWMVENHHLRAALHDIVMSAPEITVRPNSRVTSFRFDGPAATLHVDSADIVSARLVVAADGRDSAARTAAAIATFGWGYAQTGIVTTVAHEHEHQGRAEEHFLPAGPFAILPLPGRRSSLVWTEDEGEAERIMALDEEGFAGELRRRFAHHLGRVEPVGPRHAYPLSMHMARRFIAPRLALIGDAAHVIHPIAGLGFNLAMRDIAALAETTAEAVRLGLDHGGMASLERYQAWRRLDTAMVALMTDGLNRLFSNDLALLRMVRDLGLGIVDRIGPLKAFFIREAAGLHGRLPRLLNGEPV